MNTLIDAYVESLREAGSNTSEKDLRQKHRLLSALFNGHDVRQLDKHGLRDLFRKYAARKKWGVLTRRHRTGDLKKFIAWCLTESVIEDDLGVLLVRPGTKGYEPTWKKGRLKVEEIDRLCDSLPTGQMLAVVLAAYGGLRRSEIAKVEAGMYQDGILVLPAQATKSKRPRSVPLCEGARRRLEPVLAGLPPNARVCPRPMSNDVLRDALAALGIDPYRDGRRITLHALRSSLGTNLIRAEVPIADVQQILGHSSPTITAKYYNLSQVEDLRPAVERLHGPQMHRSSFTPPTLDTHHPIAAERNISSALTAGLGSARSNVMGSSGVSHRYSTAPHADRATQLSSAIAYHLREVQRLTAELTAEATTARAERLTETRPGSVVGTCTPRASTAAGEPQPPATIHSAGGDATPLPPPSPPAPPYEDRP